MKQAVGLAGTCLIALAAIGGPTTQSPAPTDYEEAIGEARVSGESDGTPWLHNCVRQWSDLDGQRRALVDEFNGRRADDIGVLLEVGNSGFGKYEFVAVIGDRVKTSGGEKSLTKSELSRLRTLLGEGFTGIHGEAVADKFDADCFFLTMRVRDQTRQVAIYGSPRQAAAEKLIGELISHIG